MVNVVKFYLPSQEREDHNVNRRSIHRFGNIGRQIVIISPCYWYVSSSGLRLSPLIGLKDIRENVTVLGYVSRLDIDMCGAVASSR